MKMKYRTPDMEVIRFQTEDVITTSGSLDENELPIDPAAFGDLDVIKSR